MKNIAANIISIIALPFLIPTYLFAIVIYLFPQQTYPMAAGNRLIEILYIFIATSVPAFVHVYSILKRHKISPLSLERKNEDRIVPQLYACFNYFFVCIYLGIIVGILNVLTLIMCSTTLTLIIISLIMPYWKISTHSAGIWGMFVIAATMHYKYPSQGAYFLIFFLGVISVLVCWARYHLRVHTITELIAGGVLGAAISILFLSVVVF